MKKVLFFFIYPLVCLCVCFPTYAQTNFFSGTVLYEITFPNGEQMLASTVPNKTLELKILDNNLSSSMFGQTIILNPNKNKVYTLLNLPALGSIPIIFQEKYTDFVKKSEIPEYEFTNDTKTIYGFKARRAYLKNAKLQDGQRVEVWYTDEIQSSADFFYTRGIGGFPLEFAIVEKGIRLKARVKSIIFGKVRATDFEYPKGYRETTKEELNNILQHYSSFESIYR